MNSELITTLDAIAKKIGTTTERIFSYYVKNQKVKLYYWFIELFVYLLISTAGLLVLFYTYDGLNNERIGLIIIFVIGVVLTLLGLVLFFTHLAAITAAINSRINPEYEATTELLNDLIKRD